MEAADIAPMPTPQELWIAAYVARMIECGVPEDHARACELAGSEDHDYDSDPREAADEEMSYWDDDGDGVLE